MNNPNVILGVHGDADGSADNPMVGKRLRPHGINFEARSLDARSFRGCFSLEHGRTDRKSDEEREKSCCGKSITLHGFLLCFAAQSTPGGDSKLFGEIHNHLTARGQSFFCHASRPQVRARMPIPFSS
jgi:hypothetical protein